MSRLDDRLTHELERVGPTRRPCERLRTDRRAAARDVTRCVASTSGAFGVVVLAGSIGGFAS